MRIKKEKLQTKCFLHNDGLLINFDLSKCVQGKHKQNKWTSFPMLRRTDQQDAVQEHQG